ncbi:MAG: succinate dehydrogenase iron-sulfur subunit [Omnitrophica bacterium RIFCSPHIGHO2_02_FULL_46_11]|nr:MAG: succinate dehydrogenase iron-sulfur subunit [Omnitrophica bacterium RIFCSPLOWO2_01_FULL_45_10b]OGW87516.1 MAG: succinate dehydrogenase iron-sulfur subunit [Omnitrophica bacterium RIFCSPHIGHO2_02_FULL_46_11]
MPDQKTVILKVKRQERPDIRPYWEEFHIPHRPYMNVITCLQEIQKRPQTFDGRKTAPVSWEQSCLEEVCGSCTMVINGRVRQACSALVDRLGPQITLEPMTKFPVVRDLVVNRRSIFEGFKRAKAWVASESKNESGPGPKISPELAEMRYGLSKCMTCGCCLEACPQFNDRSDFIGPAAINQVRLFNSHPIGAKLKENRLLALMGEGGIEDCGNAQNCVKVCPKGIPLVTSILETNREITLNLLNILKK